MVDTVITPFNPSPSANFQFQAELDGDTYNIVCKFNVYAQRYYVGIYDLSGALALMRPLVGSPDSANISLTEGYFDTTVIYRDSRAVFEIPGIIPAQAAARPPAPPSPPPRTNYAEQVQEDDPLIWWRMGDSVGSTTGTDSGSLGLPFTLTGANDSFGGPPLWADGASLVCSGTDYNAGIAAHNDAVNFQGAGFTITSLVIWNGSSNPCTIVGHGQTNVDWANWDLFITNSGQVSLYLSSANSGAARIQFTSTAIIGEGPVYRIAARWDSATGDVGLWINGDRVLTDTWAHTLWLASSPIGVATFPHASGGDTGNAQFQGNISELAIYNYPLTDARLAAQFEAL